MRNMSKALVLMMAAAIILAASSRAEAALILRLTSGASSVTVVDGGAGDANPADGAVTFIGSIGLFTINVSTGLSKPILENTANFAHMDLNSVNSSTGAGSLLIELTDTDFLATLDGKLIGNVGGTTQGSTEFWAYKCGANVEFGTAPTQCGDLTSLHLGPFASPAFSGSASAPHGPLDPYSMTLAALITHGSGVNTSSFDLDVQNIPEPASMALMGLGLLGFGAASRRRKALR